MTQAPQPSNKYDSVNYIVGLGSINRDDVPDYFSRSDTEEIHNVQILEQVPHPPINIMYLGQIMKDAKNNI